MIRKSGNVCAEKNESNLEKKRSKIKIVHEGQEEQAERSDNSSRSEALPRDLQNELKDRFYTFEHDQVKEGRKEHYSASSMGFKQRYRKTLKCPPEWITILNEAGIDEEEIISNIKNEDILEYFNNENIVFKLTDDEMTQIKSLIKEQITLESDLGLGVIAGSDDIYDLISRLAKSNGDLSKMTSKDQTAILTLVQFNNITPSFGDDYNENAIEICLEGGSDFIEFTDIIGTEIYVRKSSFVKARIMEEKIIDELLRFQNESDRKTSVMIFFGIFYLAVKILLFLFGFLYTGQSDGYSRALQEIHDYRGMTI